MKTMKTILATLILFACYTVAAQESVQIGTQVWMKQSLNVGTMIPGNTMPSNNGVIEKYCYGNVAANCDIYGGLYTWDEAMQYSNTPAAQGICPPGWHIPTATEWETLFNFLGGQKDVLDENNHVVSTGAGAKMKKPDPKRWIWFGSPTNKIVMYATNTSDFSAIGSGLRWHSGSFYYIGADFNMWLSLAVNGTTAYYGGATYATGNANYGQFYKNEGLSIRCIHD